MEPAIKHCYRHPDQPTGIQCQRCGRGLCPQCMRSAPVGFQCVDCVAKGARETRQRQAVYGGLRSENPAKTSFVLIMINAAIWMFVNITGGFRSTFVHMMSLTPRGRCLSADDPSYYFPNLDQAGCIAQGQNWLAGQSTGAPWQIISSMFTHEAIWHIGFNMVALWILGQQLEAITGRTRFLAIYLVSGLFGSAFVMWLSDPASSTLGASGAIFGMMAAFLIISYKHRGDWKSILIWIGLNVAITILGGSGISWQGHLGGFVGGLIVTGLIVFSPKTKARSATQWGSIAAVTFAIVVVIVLRMNVLG